MSVITTRSGTRHLAFHWDRDRATVITLCGRQLQHGGLSTMHTDNWPGCTGRCKQCSFRYAIGLAPPQEEK